MRRKKTYTDVSFGEFLAWAEPVPEPKKTSRLLVLIKFFAASIVAGLLVGGGLTVAAAGSLNTASPIVEWYINLPPKLPETHIATRTVMYTAGGEKFAELWDENRVVLNSLNDVSPIVIDALLATEDSRFYNNKGLDEIGLLRAILSGKGGGSGITQQLVKNLLFYNRDGDEKTKSHATENTLYRKIQELKYAVEYEKTHSKQEILLNYLNTVAFGSPNIYGIETAAKTFFHKTAKQLTLEEATLLVGTVQNPVLFNLLKPELENKYFARQDHVLGRLVAVKKITKTEEAQAFASRPQIFREIDHNSTCASSEYPFYCQYVINYMLSSPRFGVTLEERQATISNGGLVINTFLEPEILKKIDTRLHESLGETNRIIAPTAIVEPGTGGVLGIGSNRNYGRGEGETELVLADIPAATGSIYKMFGLAAALNSGMTEKDLRFSSKCPFIDPGYDLPEGGIQNSVSCKMQGGWMDYKQATAFSSNTWFVTLETKIGVEKVKQFSKNVGLAAPDSIGPRSASYILGTVENTPIKIAAAYATFANQGVYCPPTPIESIVYQDGKQFIPNKNYDPDTDSCRAVMSPQNASIVLKALKSNVSGEIAGAFGNTARIPGYDTVGKSGTNQLYNLTWAQLSSQYSLFIDMYDMEQTNRGIENFWREGRLYNWGINSAQDLGSQILRTILVDTSNIPLIYDSSIKSFTENPLSIKDYVTVPSVMGINYMEAYSLLKAQGFWVEIDKTPVGDEGLPVDTVAMQSIQGGEKIPLDYSEPIILYRNNLP